MTSDPIDWHQVLARVSGQLVRGEQRVTTHELFTVHLGVPVTDVSADAAGDARAWMARAAADALGQEDAQRLLEVSDGRPAGNRAVGTGGGRAGDAGTPNGRA